MQLNCLSCSVCKRRLFMAFMAPCWTSLLFLLCKKKQNQGWVFQICLDKSTERQEVSQTFSSTEAGKRAARVNMGLQPPSGPRCLSLRWAFVRGPRPFPSSGCDWSSSPWPQTGLGAPRAALILCGFGRVTAARLSYGALITPPPGGLHGARGGGCMGMRSPPTGSTGNKYTCFFKSALDVSVAFQSHLKLLLFLLKVKMHGKVKAGTPHHHLHTGLMFSQLPAWRHTTIAVPVECIIYENILGLFINPLSFH